MIALAFDAPERHEPDRSLRDRIIEDAAKGERIRREFDVLTGRIVEESQQTTRRVREIWERSGPSPPPRKPGEDSLQAIGWRDEPEEAEGHDEK